MFHIKMPLTCFATPVLSLPRAAKRLIVLLVDSSLCVLTLWLAFYLRLGEFVPLEGPSLTAAIVSITIALPLFVVSGLYRAIFRYSGWPALITVTKATLLYGLIYATAFTAIGLSGVPRTVGLIQPILLLLAVGGSRAMARFWLGGLYQIHLKRASLPKVLIYGAGSAGRQLAAALGNSQEMSVIGFLDDDPQLHGHILSGQRIYAPSDLANLVATLGVSDVLLALPTASRKRRNEILEQMLKVHVSVRTLPSVTELAQGKISTSELRQLDIDDLLGREPVPPNLNLLHQNITGKVVLVTGAGGSIGSELCRQIVQANARCLLLLEQSEFALYNIHQELEQRQNGHIELIPLLGSVCDDQRLEKVFSTWHPTTVYHAAAYKHVPLVEQNPSEGVRNNVLGTLTTARAAIRHGVSDFVLISTDKAVRPTNVMGASKRLAEMTLQALAAEYPTTKFTMVRFGNVLGSSGSVVPKFRQQIRDGGPVTVTHPEITRYFMTIPEAAQLVIQAGAMACGGDVFVLDMGEPVRIVDLARRMIELSGLTVRDSSDPDGDIEIEVTGLRPGEKLYEELLIGDNPEATSHPRIMKAHEDFIPWPELSPQIEALVHELQANETTALRKRLSRLVTGYTAHTTIVDLVHLGSAAASET